MGMIIPPASPCSTRNAINESADHAAPHNALVATNAPTAPIHTRRAPKRSAIHPVNGITADKDNKYAVLTHWIVASDTFRSARSV